MKCLPGLKRRVSITEGAGRDEEINYHGIGIG